MADDWYDALLKGFDADPDPFAVERLWTATDGAGRPLAALLRFRGPHGVEAQILRDGELFIGQLFARKELAVQWLEEERRALQGPSPA